MLSAVTIKTLPVCPLYSTMKTPLAVTSNMLPVYPACLILATLLVITSSMLPVHRVYPTLADPRMHTMAGGHFDRGVGAV